MARAERLSLDDPRWRGFVDSRADATPFHDPRWATLLADCYGLPGFVLANVDAGGAPTAGLPLLATPRLPRRPRRLVSLPFTDFVLPLVDREEETTLIEAIDATRRELGFDSVELRGVIAGARPAAARAVIHTLALDPDEDVLLGRLEKGKRRDVRAAQRSSLAVRRADSEREMTEAYYRLHLETRRRLGVPSQPRRFFRLLWQRLVGVGGGALYLVYDGRAAVAGAVFLASNRTMVYKYSAWDARRRPGLANDLLLWTAIRSACEQGCATFDYGRSDLGAEGLRRFKSRWGAVERPLVYSSVGARAAADASHTPSMVGSVIRRSPLWVTRVSGALLYRYAA